MRVLIVENEVMVRGGLIRLIKLHTGHTVVEETSNGQKGLSFALRFKSDLVMTDIRISVMDRLQMIETFRDTSLSIRAMILSGYSEFDYTKKVIHSGMDDYLPKPLAVEDIAGLLGRARREMGAEEQESADTPGQCIRELIYGGPLSEEEDRWVRTICGFGAFIHSQLYLGYTGDTPIGYEEGIGGKFDQIRVLLPSVRLHVSWDRGRRQFLGLAALLEDKDVLCLFYRTMEWRIVRPYKQRDGRAVWVMVSMKGWGSV